MTHQLFSQQALAQFQRFLKVDRETAHLRPRGAVDAVSPELRRALARDQKMTPFTPAMSETRGDRRRMGRDAGPIGERNLKELRKMLAEEKAKPQPSQSRIETLLFMIRQNEVREDQAEEDTWVNPNDLVPSEEQEEEFEEGREGEDSDLDDQPPYEATTGTEDEDFPETAGRNIGGPKPFKQMPERGGGMAGDAAGYHQRFPDAGRIGVDYDYGPAGSRCRYDAFGRSIDGHPIARNSRSGRGSASMALDAGTSAAEENRYSSVWGGLTDRIRLL